MANLSKQELAAVIAVEVAVVAATQQRLFALWNEKSKIGFRDKIAGGDFKRHVNTHKFTKPVPVFPRSKIFKKQKYLWSQSWHNYNISITSFTNAKFINIIDANTTAYTVAIMLHCYRMLYYYFHKYP